MNNFEDWLVRNKEWIDIGSVFIAFISGFLAIFSKTRRKTPDSKLKLTSIGWATIILLIISLLTQIALKFAINLENKTKEAVAKSDKAKQDSTTQTRFETEITKLENLNRDLKTFSRTSIKNDVENNQNLKGSLHQLSDINLRMKYPLPNEILANIKVAWSVANVNQPINSIIKTSHRKAFIESAYELPYRFFIDSSYNIFFKLSLGFKSIRLIFKKGQKVAIYHVTIWPSKIIPRYEKFYHPYDLNKFTDAFFVYDSSKKRISFNAVDCKLQLSSLSNNMSSLLDLDNSIISLEINTDIEDVHHELNVEDPANYLFGYQMYDAHEDNNGPQRKATFDLSINFNQMFTSSYRNVVAGKLVIDTFKLDHN